MSLINKMLQELDKRHAAQSPIAPAGDAPRIAHPRPVQGARVGSELFWWALAVLMVAGIGWLGWVMWQLTPRTVVNEVALRSAPRPAVKDPVAPAVSDGESARTQEASAPAPASMAAAASPDMLKLATEITTPIAARRPLAASAGEASAKPAAPKPEAAPPATGQAAAAASASAEKPAPAMAARPESAHPVVVAKPIAPASSPSRPAAQAANAGKIDKRVTSTPRERAEAEYRRAAGLVNQGRVAEGMDGLRNALTIDVGYEAARQTLVALLVEQRRLDDAVSELLQGLEFNPSNSAFAMLLARILVDRQNLPAAVAILQKHAPAAGASADYHAFLAALYQRLNRHDEAIQEYKGALQLSPRAGVWWVGLGISQEAAGHRKEALEAFRQAQAIGNLGSEMLAYVDQRLKSLQ